MRLRRKWVGADESPRIVIVHRMMDAGRKWMTLSEIARRCKLPRQLVAYHLPFLVREGVVLESNGKYVLQDVFYKMEEYMSYLEPMVLSIASDVRAVEGCSLEDLTHNCLRYMLAVLSIDVDGNH